MFMNQQLAFTRAVKKGRTSFLIHKYSDEAETGKIGARELLTQ